MFPAGSTGPTPNPGVDDIGARRAIVERRYPWGYSDLEVVVDA
jgi:hypothetical protein